MFSGLWSNKDDEIHHSTPGRKVSKSVLSFEHIDNIENDLKEIDEESIGEKSPLDTGFSEENTIAPSKSKGSSIRRKVAIVHTKPDESMLSPTIELDDNENIQTVENNPEENTP